MLRRIFLAVVLLLSAYCSAIAQQDSTTGSVDTVQRVYRQRRPMGFLDSVARAIELEEKAVSDSLAMVYILRPDSTRPSLFVDSILKANAYKGDHYFGLAARARKDNRSGQGYGHLRPSRDPWVLVVIVLLVLFASALNIYANKDLSNIFSAFYGKRSAALAGKEESPITTWTFIGLFILFGLTSGIVLYQLTTGYYKVYYTISGVQLFVTLSLTVIGLFAAKFVVLWFLGLVFNSGKLVGEYIKALSLTYFNITFVFLPVAACLSLASETFVTALLYLTGILIVVIFVWQYLRSSVGIVANFRFHKFYLFIYLCALEICPILVLIKALNIGFR